MKENKIKKSILGLILMVMLFPLFNGILTVVSGVEPLKGYEEPVPDSTFNFTSWFSGDYQPLREKYLSSSLSMATLLIRINNQIRYWAFNEAKIKNVVIGKENCLYEYAYIESYQGQNYIGDQETLDKVVKLKFLQDTLAKLGKQLVVVLEPGKASFFPEYIPDNLIREHKTSNYSGFKKFAQEKGLEVFDANAWFVQMKKTSEYPLYSRYGIHWTEYGATLAVDSLFKYLEKKRGQDLYNIAFDGVELSDTARGTDHDIMEAMNLLVPLKDNVKLAYPVSRKVGEDLYKPKVLSIADSYYWNWFNMEYYRRSISDSSRFWYYDREEIESNIDLSKVDLKEVIKNNDVIIIASTEATNYDIGWGFIEKLYKAMSRRAQKSKEDIWIDNRAQQYLQEMKSKPEWLRALKEKAKNANQPLDSIMKWDAYYMVEQELKNK